MRKAIWYCFLALAAVTPLIFSSHNSELFEVPKMLIVYGLSTIVLTLTLLKFVLDKKIVLPKNTVVYIFLIFLAFQTLSTIFSIDPFTSVFGYPTRLNGGLFSQLAYFIIFVCALINLNKATWQSQREASEMLIAISVIGAFAVSLWGIPSHFGWDPTCFILTNKLTSACWQAEFQPTLRIFATLGQPNWLASYLVLVFPLSLVLLLLNRAKRSRIIFGFASAAIFLALLFTNSRAGIAGAVLAIAVFTTLLGKNYLLKNIKIVIPLIVVIAIIFAGFGSTLVTRVKELQSGKAAGGTETSVIRLIVWQGALDIFKNHPLLGTGPETFAYAYQKVRPIAHNNTTEWDFFYNKAHNEFLNYLANTGILGTLGYLSLLYFVLLRLYKTSKDADRQTQLIAKGTIAGILGYQLTILFGFSVVATQTIMYLLAATALALGKLNFKEIPLSVSGIKKYALITVVLVSGLWLIVSTLRLYFADILITRAKATYSPGRATTIFDNAILTFPVQNPFYAADFASSAAVFSGSYSELGIAEDFAATANTYAQISYKIAPHNFLNIRKIVNAYTVISGSNETYKKSGEALASRLMELAPTDPQSYNTAAKFYLAEGDKEKAAAYVKKALELKHDYVDAQETQKQLETIDNSAPRTEN